MSTHQSNNIYDNKSTSYTELGILGEGCIGLVKAVERKSDKKLFAVKIVKTNDEEIIKNVILLN
jgi:calcium/calmodulin-dependent protein kinase I